MTTAGSLSALGLPREKRVTGRLTINEFAGDGCGVRIHRGFRRRDRLGHGGNRQENLSAGAKDGSGREDMVGVSSRA